jgi:pentatricopeptide repeat protein
MYLLDVLRRRTPSTTPDPALEALLGELTIPDVPPNIVIYTTMIRGLTNQSEYDAAWDVADRMPFDGADDPVLLKVFAKLAMAGGRRRRRVALKTTE